MVAVGILKKYSVLKFILLIINQWGGIRAIRNIQNKDEKSFLWCVLRYLYPTNLNDTRSTDSKQKPKPLKLTKEEQQEFYKAEFCHICEKELYDDDSTGKMLKVRDHCHFTGKYRGAAHNFGHLQCRKPMILVQSYFTVFRVMTNICLSNDLPKSKVDWHVIQQLPGGGGYSRFQVTRMIEWSQKPRPKKIPRASSKSPKNPWTKSWPQKIPCRFCDP